MPYSRMGKSSGSKNALKNNIQVTFFPVLSSFRYIINQFIILKSNNHEKKEHAYRFSRLVLCRMG